MSRKKLKIGPILIMYKIYLHPSCSTLTELLPYCPWVRNFLVHFAMKRKDMEEYRTNLQHCAKWQKMASFYPLKIQVLLYIPTAKYSSCSTLGKKCVNSCFFCLWLLYYHKYLNSSQSLKELWRPIRDNQSRSSLTNRDFNPIFLHNI